MILDKQPITKRHLDQQLSNRGGNVLKMVGSNATQTGPSMTDQGRELPGQSSGTARVISSEAVQSGMITVLMPSLSKL